VGDGGIYGQFATENGTREQAGDFAVLDHQELAKVEEIIATWLP
jgi:hypothetical protein